MGFDLVPRFERYLRRSLAILLLATLIVCDRINIKDVLIVEHQFILDSWMMIDQVPGDQCCQKVNPNYY